MNKKVEEIEVEEIPPETIEEEKLIEKPIETPQIKYHQSL